MDVFRESWFLAGPTAVGKSAVGLILAKQLNAEIVSLDSMAVYRRMDIGTAKPSVAQQAQVAHHLLDLVEPHEEFSLADYVEAAETVCREILSRGKKPLFVGGTGLYLRGILRGVFNGPAADWEFRRALQDEAERHSPESVHARLQQVDPQSAAALHPNDTRRVIRALEVHHQTGRPLSEQQKQAPLPQEDRPRNVYWLAPPRQWLYERINVRVEAMIAAGLLEEVRQLLSAPQPLSRTARQALGYQEAIKHLENSGDLTRTITRIQTHTRQFAKRQHTWFRNLEECREVEITGDEQAAEIAERLLVLGESDVTRL